MRWPKVDEEATAIPITLNTPISTGLLAVRSSNHVVQLLRRWSINAPLWLIECKNSVISRPASATCCGSETAKQNKNWNYSSILRRKTFRYASSAFRSEQTKLLNLRFLDWLLLRLKYSLLVMTISISSSIRDNVLVNALLLVERRDLCLVVQLISNFTEERTYICLFFKVVGWKYFTVGS